MAKPDDTRIAPASANTTPSSTTSNTPGSTHRSSPNHSPTRTHLTPILEALLARQASQKPAPVQSKAARLPRIKPRRRVTVSASLSPDSNVEIPTIRLGGHWLDHAGFGLHTRLYVHVGEGVLILLPEHES